MAPEERFDADETGRHPPPPPLLPPRRGVFSSLRTTAVCFFTGSLAWGPLSRPVGAKRLSTMTN